MNLKPSLIILLAIAAISYGAYRFDGNRQERLAQSRAWRESSRNRAQDRIEQSRRSRALIDSKEVAKRKKHEAWRMALQPAKPIAKPVVAHQPANPFKPVAAQNNAKVDVLKAQVDKANQNIAMLAKAIALLQQENTKQRKMAYYADKEEPESEGTTKFFYLNDLSDFVIVNPQKYQVLTYDGSVWTNDWVRAH